MPHADELRMGRKRLQLCDRVVRLQIDPADHAGDERMRVGQLEQPARLLERLPRLHGNARVNDCAVHLTPRVGGQEVAPQTRHRLVDPTVLRCVVAPEMLM